MARYGRWIVIGAPVLAIAIQAIRPARTNPPIDPARTIEARTGMPEDVRAVINRACADCHTYKTVWPWYSSVAPVSWFLAHDVSSGRRDLALSDWASYSARQASRKLDSMCEKVKNGSMPPGEYRWMHPTATLSEDDQRLVCAWTDREVNAIKGQ